MPAPRDRVFDLLHDYERRLQWDTLLSEAYLAEGHQRAGPGAVSVCRGRRRLGHFALRTEYISFRRPAVAAVKMVNRPPFFETFAATIRHEELPGGSSSLEYKYRFTARPRWCRFLLHPLMAAVFRWETRKRLLALRRFIEGSAERG